jgi:hypothetical protein
MTMTRCITRTARAAVLAAGLVAAPAARAQIAVMSSTVEEHVASPGSRYTGDIVIANPTREPQAVRIYQTDYRFLADGTSNFDDPGSQPRSNASWIVPQATRITVPAGTRITVPYSVTVPAGDSLRGTYWSAVMVEGVAPVPTAADAQKLALGSVMRYAIQVATHIDATGERNVRFDAPSAGLTPAGSAMLDLDVMNTGERGVRPALSVEVYDAEGHLRARAKQQRGLLYPGTSLHQRFELGALPPGTYKAVVYADTGAEPVLATQYTISW